MRKKRKRLLAGLLVLGLMAGLSGTGFAGTMDDWVPEDPSGAVPGNRMNQVGPGYACHFTEDCAAVNPSFGTIACIDAMTGGDADRAYYDKDDSNVTVTHVGEFDWSAYAWTYFTDINDPSLTDERVDDVVRGQGYAYHFDGGWTDIAPENVVHALGVCSIRLNEPFTY